MLDGKVGREDQKLAADLKVVFPDPAHVNISGAGVTRYSRKAPAARALIEFLASPTGGEGYAAANHEYPLRGFGDEPVLERLGSFRGDGVSVAQMGATNEAAVKLMQTNGWQ
jgi:iron(III) transport system substrate-binding protein